VALPDCGRAVRAIGSLDDAPPSTIEFTMKASPLSSVAADDINHSSIFHPSRIRAVIIMVGSVNQSINQSVM